MNLSLITDVPVLSPEIKSDLIPKYREREQKVLHILEAIHSVLESPAWKVLKDEAFDGLTKQLERELASESRSEHPDVVRLARLGGQLKWAERYSDLGKLESEYKVELTSIRKTLNGTNSTNAEGDGG